MPAIRNLGSIGDAGDAVHKGNWYSGEKQMYQRQAEANSVPKGPDPLWCVVCRKRFKSSGVFDGHLTGKKHIGALKAAVKDTSNPPLLVIFPHVLTDCLWLQGKVQEAEAMKQRIVDQKNRTELSQAQETAISKRSRPMPRDEHAERDKKIAKGCFERGFEREGAVAAKDAKKEEEPAAAAAMPHAAAVKASAAELAAEYKRPNPNGIAWWEGNPVEKDQEEDDGGVRFEATFCLILTTFRPCLPPPLFDSIRQFQTHFSLTSFGRLI